MPSAGPETLKRVLHQHEKNKEDTVLSIVVTSLVASADTHHLAEGEVMSLLVVSMAELDRGAGRSAEADVASPLILPRLLPIPPSTAPLLYLLDSCIRKVTNFTCVIEKMSHSNRTLQ